MQMGIIVNLGGESSNLAFLDGFDQIEGEDLRILPSLLALSDVAPA